MLEPINALDREIFLFLNNLGTSAWDPFWLLVTDKWTATPIYAVLLYLIFKKFGVKGALITLVLITLLITATDQLANVFKHYFQRFRPCGQEGIMEQARFVAERCGRYGYFSAHASNTAGVAVFLGILLKKFYPYLLILLFLWSLIVSYSRIYLGVHYPGDVITGILIGALMGYFFTMLHLYLFNRFRVPAR